MGMSAARSVLGLQTDGADAAQAPQAVTRDNTASSRVDRHTVFAEQDDEEQEPEGQEQEGPGLHVAFALMAIGAASASLVWGLAYLILR